MIKKGAVKKFTEKRAKKNKFKFGKLKTKSYEVKPHTIK